MHVLASRPHADDLFLAVALELVLEIGVEKPLDAQCSVTTMSPSLDLEDHVKGCRPCAFAKSLTLAAPSDRATDTSSSRYRPVPSGDGARDSLDAGLAAPCAQWCAGLSRRLTSSPMSLTQGQSLPPWLRIVVEIDAEKRRDLGVVGSWS